MTTGVIVHESVEKNDTMNTDICKYSNNFIEVVFNEENCHDCENFKYCDERLSE